MDLHYDHSVKNWFQTNLIGHLLYTHPTKKQNPAKLYKIEKEKTSTAQNQNANATENKQKYFFAR